MTTLLVIIWGVLLVSLVIVAAVRPERTKHSWFELERRRDNEAMRRERLLGSLIGLQQFLILVFVSLLAVIAFVLWEGWGIPNTLVALLAAFGLAQWKVIHQSVMKQYKRREPALLDFSQRISLLGKLLGGSNHVKYDQRLESSEQLIHLVESAGHILTSEQQRLIRRGLEWHMVTVSEVMTPRDSIESVKSGELLGPLVLNDLHQTGHTVFPVTKRDLDHVIGVIDIAEHLRVEKSRSSQTAEQVMIPEIFTVLEDAPLPVALHLLLSTRQPLLVVTGIDDKTTGMVTLRDILGALLGKNI